MNKPVALHAFIFPLCPIVFLYTHNLKNSYVPLAKVLFFLIAILVLSLAIFLLLNLFIKNQYKSSIIETAFFLLIFYFPYWHRIGTKQDGPLISFAIFLGLYLAIAVFMVICYVILRTSANLCSFTHYTNLMSIILLLIIIVNSGYGLIFNNKNVQGVYKSTYFTQDNDKHQNYPNIIYLILDAYARNDILKELYGFDNSEFLSYLQRRGFSIVPQSQSNYSITVCSLASSLNYMYLDRISAKLGADNIDNRPLAKMISDSRIRQFLSNYGYKFVAFSSGYYPTEIKDADLYIPSKANMEFESIVCNRTLIGRIFHNFALELQKNSHKERILKIFDNLPAVAQQNSPAFLFVHLVSPHPPFVFSRTELWGDYIYADGSQLHHMRGDLRQRYIKAYTEQIVFLNSKLKTLIDALLTQSPKPIIILQADHGPRSTMDWDSPLNANIKENVSIFNAIFLPNREALYDSLTPVNTFRIILRDYFKVNIELLDDKSYFLAGVQHPYRYYRLDGLQVLSLSAKK